MKASRQVRHIGVRLEGERDGAVRHLSFEAGPTLRDVLNRSSVRVRAGCAGTGACGLCRVRIDEGDAGAPTQAELLHLGDDGVAARERLACQVTPRGDMDVTVLVPARPSPWRVPPRFSYRPTYPRRVADGPPLGVAIDVGTTQITVAICDVEGRRYAAVRSGPNPQADLGADVIGRLDAAARSPETAQHLRELVLDAIGGALFDLSVTEGIALSAVGRVLVVGNSAMLTLLSGGQPGAVLDPGHWGGDVACQLDDASELAATWCLAPDADIELVQPLGGFVGSDLLAGAVHCRFVESREPALLVDFGTNTEIALWDGERLWATAAAGGPAFEAIGIGCGLPAEPGAIHRLSRNGDGAWSGDVLESGSPRGVCGSGLIDLLAILVAAGEIDERGRPAAAPITFSVEGAEFALSKADVDALQRGKAAVAAGIDVLCRRAGVGLDELCAVHVGGTFGEHLDLEHAARVGLLPPIAAERARLAGNTALHGALDLLLSDEAQASLALARERVKLINLSMEADFEELFVEHLFIRPMGAGAPR
jgi:uncharacterized 2Fe-2S/4Fe-4S cluster protein (DUF4445 family)